MHAARREQCCEFWGGGKGDVARHSRSRGPAPLLIGAGYVGLKALASVPVLDLRSFPTTTRGGASTAERCKGNDAETAARRAADAQVLTDAERLIGAWNERQARRMPLLFAPTIGAALAARHHFL
jgi:hypothetical protein